MFFILSKILQFLISPYTWVFILIVWGFFNKNSKKKKRLLLWSIIVFYFFSNDFLIDEAYRIYEERDQKLSELSSDYDAVIILGGFVTYDNYQNMEKFRASTDRFLQGYKIYKLHKAKKIMLVGGSGSISNPENKEGPIISHYLQQVGLPLNDIIVESESKNTHENATKSALILNKIYPDGKFLLVTSGFHMPRAKRCFKKTGLNVTPFSVDQYAGKRKFVFDHLFIPDVEAMRKWEIIIHEWVGFISYKLVGYI